MNAADPEIVVAAVRAGIASRTRDRLENRAVEALDVVGHALCYCGVVDAREAWLRTLRSGKLDELGSSSITTMVLGLNDAILSGDDAAVADVCDCLGVLFGAGRLRSGDVTCDE